MTDLELQDVQASFPPALREAMAEARSGPVSVPGFEALASGLHGLELGRSLAVRRATWLLLVAAAVFLVGTVAAALLFKFMPEPKAKQALGLWRYASTGGVRAALIACLLPGGALLWSASRLPRAGFRDHVLIRAVAWSTLVVGTLLPFTFDAWSFRLVGHVAALGSGVALLSLREVGLDAEMAAGTPFVPIKHRGPLIVALVMATADAMTLLFAGLVSMEVGAYDFVTFAPGSIPTLIAGLVMVLAVFGLYRLRVWALVLNLVANVVIAYLAFSGVLGLSVPVAIALTSTAIIQTLLPVPVLAAAAGDREAGQGWLHNQGHRLGYGLIVGLMVLGLSPSALGVTGTGWRAAQVHYTTTRGINHLYR